MTARPSRSTIENRVSNDNRSTVVHWSGPWFPSLIWCETDFWRCDTMPFEIKGQVDGFGFCFVRDANPTFPWQARKQWVGGDITLPDRTVTVRYKQVDFPEVPDTFQGSWLFDQVSTHHYVQEAIASERKPCV